MSVAWQQIPLLSSVFQVPVSEMRTLATAFLRGGIGTTFLPCPCPRFLRVEAHSEPVASDTAAQSVRIYLALPFLHSSKLVLLERDYELVFAVLAECIRLEWNERGTRQQRTFLASEGHHLFVVLHQCSV